MSEARWWKMGEVPTEPGMYVSLRDGGAPTGWVFPGEESTARNSDRRNERQFYGPIPEPPKEPPKLRRFTAKHKRHGNVSGVYVEPSPKNPELYFNFAFWYLRENGARDYSHGEESDFDSIDFIDKE